MTQLTRDALAIWQAGVDAVRSDRVVERAIDFDGRWLTIEDESFDLKGIKRLIVVGAGKATFGMLQGLLRVAHRTGLDRIPIVGWVNVPEGVTDPSDHAWTRWPVQVAMVRPRGANEPTLRVVEGTDQIRRLVSNATKDDAVIALISGGGSALLCSPIDGISLETKIAITRRLSASGASITQLNSVRRCLSNVKGGGLARTCRASQFITCIISDVLGDPIEFIASGPTVLDPIPVPVVALKVLRDLIPNEFAEAEQILNKQLQLSSVSKNESISTEPVHLILANNVTAVDAAGVKAVELGYRYWMHAAREPEGDASIVGDALAKQLVMTAEQSHIDCIISGGEPTVTLPPLSICGRGGRNQQLALRLLDSLNEQRMWSNDLDLAFVSGGTDGEDGPTDAAGAWVDRDVWQMALSKGLNAQNYLDRCDAYSFFEQTGGLLITGPTNTNVCDLRIGLVRHGSIT